MAPVPWAQVTLGTADEEGRRRCSKPAGLPVSVGGAALVSLNGLGDGVLDESCGHAELGLELVAVDDERLLELVGHFDKLTHG
jgi:hypothetical protein